MHDLVLRAFVGPPPARYVCRHLNNTPSDCRLSNIEWSSVSVNQMDRVGNGTSNRGEANGSAKLTADDVRAIRGSSSSRGTLAGFYGVTVSCIDSIKRRRTWDWLE